MLTRRDLLQRIGTGFGVIGLASLMNEQNLLATPQAGNPLAPRAGHFPARAKRIIHVFMNGGPSQVDTFDPKPELTRNHGRLPGGTIAGERGGTRTLMASPFRFSQHGQSGLPVSEIFPKVAECADDLCVIRSMYTNVPNHEPSLLMMTCGDQQPVRPSMGSWLVYGLGTENQNLPGFITMCPGNPVVGPALWSNSFLPGIFQGAHINNSNMDPRRVLQNLSNTYLSPAAQREQMDLMRRLNQMHLERRGGSDNPLEARIQSMEMAFRMQFEAQEVFDLNRETAATRDLYGRGQFNDACLVARRLVERGVRAVQIFTGAGQPWDDHGNIMNHRNNARTVDQPIAALLKDLKSRGLLEDTLVLWGGEFGRTSTSEGANGRDHNSSGFSVWLAGGGVKGGYAWGATDPFGFSAAEGRMHVHDLHATILHLMGIDHTRLTYRYSGRDFRLTDVSGTVNHNLFA
ncbi:MAG: DUF1501 domain-containing protein [Planctomycetes bacterium]|nr:DUF1501 domain-containing protein [Planctomycetota bacterium]